MNEITSETRHSPKKQMKISQLCQESGFKKSTIHYYLNIGVLDPPRKSGLNLYIYDESHLAQLQEIRHLREQEKLPLGVIKEIFQQRKEPQKSLPLKVAPSQLADKKREQILKTAVELFSQKGYEKTTIADIADALSMAKGTFYLYFKDKRELFIECIERITLVIVPQEDWEDIRDEKDMACRAYERVRAFQKAFPGFRGILNLLRNAMAGDDPILAQKAKDAFKTLIHPMAKDVSRGIEAGVFRKVDPELVSYFQLVTAEMLGFRLMMDDRYTLDEGIEKLLDYGNNGLLARTVCESQKNAQGGVEGEVTDQKGISTRLRRIRCDEKEELIGRLGSAEVHIELSNIDALNFSDDGSKRLVRLTMRDVEDVTIEVSGDVKLTGLAPFGRFSIPLRAIRTVAFFKVDA